ncbi:MAG: hypothetical protein HY645_13550 [Acidobacteria bacterium]|nr:hypothetical protein [Acidobacteriota bacterium]
MSRELTVPDHKPASVGAARVLTIGSNRAARENLRHLLELPVAPGSLVRRVDYLDAVPGRASQLAVMAASAGLESRGYDSVFTERAPVDLVDQYDAVVFTPDNAATIADGFRMLLAKPVVAYLLLGMPDGLLFGVAAIGGVGDEPNRHKPTAFFDAVQRVTARSRARDFWGENAPSQYRTMEPAYRQVFGRHLQDNLSRILAGLEPESYPMEITRDGRSMNPMVVHDSGGGWAEPRQLAEMAINEVGVLPGRSFVIAEIGPQGLRFHIAQLRKIDRELSVQGTVRFDPDAFEQAIREAERKALSARNRVITTD